KREPSSPGVSPHTSPAPAAAPRVASPADLLAALGASDLPAPFKQALEPLIRESGPDLDHVRRQIEHWYEAVMVRASGWYKQKVQWIIVSIALLAAWVANADTLMIV